MANNIFNREYYYHNISSKILFMRTFHSPLSTLVNKRNIVAQSRNSITSLFRNGIYTTVFKRSTGKLRVRERRHLLLNVMLNGECNRRRTAVQDVKMRGSRHCLFCCARWIIIRITHVRGNGTRSHGACRQCLRPRAEIRRDSVIHTKPFGGIAFLTGHRPIFVVAVSPQYASGAIDQIANEIFGF